MEGLESRQMLTTLNGGDVFLYQDSTGSDFRITVLGNTQAEFVGAIAAGNNLTLGNLVPPSQNNPSTTDLFAIYVGTSDWDSSITIEQVSIDQSSGRITPTPFGAGVGLNVTNARNGNNLAMGTNAGTGAAFLGARSDFPNNGNADNHPVITGNLPGQIGILPTDSGPWGAGLIVADGNDLGRFLFDGTISGNVDIGGSINLFYAGNVLTGDTEGSFISSFPPFNANNFNVDGDLRDLVVSGSVGTDSGGNFGPGDDPIYITRFQMHVGGHLGGIDVNDSFLGTVDANDQDRYFRNDPQLEVEARGTLPTFSAGFLNDTLGNGDDAFRNDTFDTPQFLGTRPGGILVDGTLEAFDRDNFRDYADYYGVPLMAGQTVTVQLTDTTFAGLPGGPPVGIVNLVNIGVYDPDGRLIATDYSDVDPLEALGKPFQFTAQRPGIYRFAVGESFDADFNGPTGEFVVPPVGQVLYELSIEGAGNLGIGAIAAGNSVVDPEEGANGFVAHAGDFGAINAGNRALWLPKLSVFVGPGPGPAPEFFFGVVTDDGNLRAIEAGQIGRMVAVPTEGPDLSIGNGDVGLLRSTSNSLSVNESQLLVVPPGSTFPVAQPNLPRNYQVVDSQTMFLGALIADQKIGIIRAGTMGTLAPSIITVNADKFGDDGVIDLIDVAGDFGTLPAGGPWITTGPKGNVRYLNVGGDLFRDEFFGGGEPDLTVFNPGQAATITDDSGAIIKITPASGSRFNPATLGVLTYGIRGSGGSAIVRIESTQSISIKSSTRKNSSPAEIGRIVTTGTGQVVGVGANGLPVLLPGPALNVDINGKARVDVYRIEGGNFSRIANKTPGEMVTVLANSIGIIEGQNVGTPKHSTPAEIVGENVLVAGPAYPFLDQTTGIIVSGSVVQAKGYGQIGNLSVGGGIRSVTADSKTPRSSTTFEGITGPISAGGPIGDVSIGAGILPSGTGNLARAGIFAGGRIGTVRGKLAANIRGNIVSEDSIGRIDLVNGGSIINANIEVVTNMNMAREFSPATAPDDVDTVDNPSFEIGQITLNGDLKGKVNARRPKPVFRGGIIGSLFLAADIGTTLLKGGSFGILNSVYTIVGDGVINKLQTDGYGLRDMFIFSGARTGDILAQGKGESISARLFTSDLRESETQSFDPFFQTPPNRLTDLHKFLGTSENTPTINGITNAGIIAGVTANASRDLKSLTAWKLVGNTDDQPSVFNYANHIRKIVIAEDIFDVDITTGQLDLFKVGHDVINLDMTVAGPIGNINIGHDYDQQSRIRAIGPDGGIDSIFVGHDLDGNMSAELEVNFLRVNGLYNGDVTVNGVRIPES